MQLTLHAEFVQNLEKTARSLPDGFSLYRAPEGWPFYGIYIFPHCDPKTSSPIAGQSIFIVCPYFTADGKQMHYGLPVDFTWDKSRIIEELQLVVEKAHVASTHPETWQSAA